MSNCKDCLCFDVCDPNKKIEADLLERCEHFKDRNRFIELPCVAIVEQFLDSDGKTDKRRTDHNGRMAVVYINRHKYAVPSIDLTSQRYNTAQAYERIEELNRQEAEQALKESETNE